MRHSADDSAVEHRHAEERHHDLHKVGVAQHCRRSLDHVPGCSVALQPRAQHRLGKQQAMLGMNVEDPVDSCCGLKDVIIWNVHHAVAVLVLVLPGCGLCEAVHQEPLCAFVDFKVDTLRTCVLGFVAAVDDG